MASKDQLEYYIKCREDPWFFITNNIFTRDAVDSDNPVKLYPDYDYLKFLVRLWQKEKHLLVPKSRRMTASWTFLAINLWDCIFHRGRETAVVSKKEDDSAELVARIEFMFNHIPPDKIPKALLPTIDGGKMKKSPPKITFDFGDGSTSYCAGFPVGADQLRQFTFSSIFVDEAAFMREAEEFYTGARPTILGGGRMIMVSSRSPGFFKRLVFDQVNSKSDNFPELPPVASKHPMQGIEIWRNPKNGFVIADIHYSAHPERRAPAYKEMLKNTLPLHQYLREYEKNWSTFRGLSVYPNFRKDIHITNNPKPILGLPLLCGVDFGLTPACVVGQLQKNHLVILHEFTSQNEGIKTFMPAVMNQLKHLYPEWNDMNKDYYFFIDPAGFQRAQTDARTCAQEMEESAHIVNIEPGPVLWEQRRTSVEHFLLYIDKDGAGLQLSQQNCPMLIEGFNGGYRYADKQAEVESIKPQPVKDKFSHPQDALQYLAWGASQHSTNTKITIAEPSYSFTRGDGQKMPHNYGRIVND